MSNKSNEKPAEKGQDNTQEVLQEQESELTAVLKGLAKSIQNIDDRLDKVETTFNLQDPNNRPKNGELDPYGDRSKYNTVPGDAAAVFAGQRPAKKAIIPVTKADGTVYEIEQREFGAIPENAKERFAAYEEGSE